MPATWVSTCVKPKLSLVLLLLQRPVGVVICKLDMHRNQALRGYVAMLVVDKQCRGKRVGEWNIIYRPAQGTRLAYPALKCQGIQRPAASSRVCCSVDCKFNQARDLLKRPAFVPDHSCFRVWAGLQVHSSYDRGQVWRGGFGGRGDQRGGAEAVPGPWIHSG